MNWYQLEAKKVGQSLGASENGLSAGEVEKRLAQYGANKLVEAEEISRLRILLH
jgi:magnesium-transporting ATPase (P-type)